MFFFLSQHQNPSVTKQVSKIDKKHSSQAEEFESHCVDQKSLMKIFCPILEYLFFFKHMNSPVCQAICSYTYSQRDDLSPVFKNSGLSSLGHKFILLKNLGYLALPSARIQHDAPWRFQMLDMFRLFSDVLRDRVPKKIQMPCLQ